MHYWRDRGDEEPDGHTRPVDAASDAVQAIAAWVLDRLDLDTDLHDRYRRRITHP